MARGENISLRKDGRFEARFAKGRDESGKLIYGFCYGRTYEEAKEKARRAKLAAGIQMPDARRQESVFSVYCDNWFTANSTRLKPSSCAKYHAVIKNHIKPCFGCMLPCEITSEQVDAFIQMLLYEKNLSVETTRNILSLFHSLLEYTGKRSKQKLPEIEIIYPKMIRKSVRVLDQKEEERLVRYLAGNMDLCRFGIYTALRTGLRIGEVCALRWKDISLEALTISVRHTVQRIQSLDAGACRKTEVTVGTPKSDSSIRTIPLMPDIAALCTRFFQGDPESFLLTGTRQCMEPRNLQRRLKICMKECQIQEVHFHTLRHTFATRCIEAGFDIKTLSEILGHSNTSITLNQYFHPNLDLKRENMSRLKTVISF